MRTAARESFEIHADGRRLEAAWIGERTDGPGCGHAPHRDAPEATTAAVVELVHRVLDS